MFRFFVAVQVLEGLRDALMVLAKLHESFGCFVGAYLSVGILPGLNAYNLQTGCVFIK